MGTNELVAIFQEMAQSQKAIITLLSGQKSIVGPLGPNSVLITTMILTQLAPIFASIAIWIKQRSIEKAVNGDRIILQEREAKANLEIAELKISKAVMEERSRLRDVADVKKEAGEIKAIAKEEGKAEAVKEIIAVSNKQTNER